MYKIAIVDDEFEALETLEDYFKRFEKEYDETLVVQMYKNSINFIEEYSFDFDVIFLDIDMPQMDGLKLAHRIRKILSKYAIKGYEVNALDYVLKPLEYDSFKLKVKRAIDICAQRNANKKYITIPCVGQDITIEQSELYYVEINIHTITYYPSRGNFTAYGTMQSVEEFLPSDIFLKCNRSCLVNLEYVKRLEQNKVTIADRTFEISRSRKKDFVKAFYDYVFSKVE